MAHARRFEFALAGALAMGLLLNGATQAAPAHQAKARAAQPHAKITAAQARTIALKKFPGKAIGKTPLEDEEGTWQYGVMVQSGKTLREVMVNAKTGKIDSVEVTTASKEGVEATAEAAKTRPESPRKARPAKAAAKPSAKHTVSGKPR